MVRGVVCKMLNEDKKGPRPSGYDQPALPPLDIPNFIQFSVIDLSQETFRPGLGTSFHDPRQRS